MRVNNVTIAGFGPYKDEQRVDFDAFADDGIFLIGGKTGAGKSSILDAICYALYNGVPRYDETEARLRSDHCGPDDPTLVTLEFTVGEHRYLLERSPDYERPKKRGDGMTTASAEARLAIWQESQWVGLQSGPRDVGIALDEILRLKKDQFLQVILLAQNRFQQFLLSKNDDRQRLLRTLFSTLRFKEYEESLLAKRASFEKQVELARQKTRQYLAQAMPLLPDAAASPDAADRLDAERDIGTALAAVGEQLIVLRELVADAAGRASDTRARYLAASVEHDARTKTHERQLRKRRATIAHAQLDEAAPTIELDRAGLQLAVRADAVWPFITGKRRTAEALSAALIAETTARDVYTATIGSEAATTATELTSELKRLGKQLGRLEPALEHESALPELRQSREAAVRERDAASVRVDDLVERQKQLPALLTDAHERRATAQLLAARQDSAQADLVRFSTARAAAVEAAKLAEQVRAADERELSAGRTRTQASGHLDDLRHRRLHGHAAELASQLADGEPCAVCGSTTHPRPAMVDGEPVTNGDIEQAEVARAAAETDAAQASTAANSLRVKLGEQNAKADNRSANEIDALISAAESSVRESRDAAAEVASITSKLESLQAEADTLDQALVTARAERDAASANCIQAQTMQDAAQKSIASHRGAHETVAARAAALGEQIAAAQSLADALSTSDERRRALTSAEDTCADQLAASNFATEDDAADARMSASEQQRASGRIRSHDDGLAAATATLAEPELQGLADQIVDVGESASALAEAESERDAGRTAHDTLTMAETQAAGLIAQAHEAHGATSTASERFEIVRRLAATLHGETPNTKRMKLEAYVLAAQLEEIVAAANDRLGQMSGGRYRLEHSDALSFRNAQSGLGVTVLDLHTGRSRSTNSLSGGETFLASLALALGLAEVVTSRAGGITLDTLFIDEGFGSLDSETLEIAMATLDSLRAGGRTVGLISHVEAMKEQIPAKLAIDVADGGWSVIRQ